MSAQIGSKLAPRGKRGKFIKKADTGPLIIDPNRVGQIALNRDAIQALTLANAKVQVTIAAGGTTAVLVSEETGKQIGGVDDLSKLLSLRSFVTKEKKATASSEAREQAILAALRTSFAKRQADESYQQGVLDNGFILAVKPYITMCNNVRAHEAVLEGNFGTTPMWKATVRKYCVLTRAVITKVVSALVAGEKEKGLLETFSFEHKLPAYIRNKLVTKSLALTKDMDMSRVLFPSDPSKGLSLTVKEWQSIAFMKSMGHLVKNSEAIVTWIQSKSLFLELIGMTAEEYANKEDPKVQRVDKTRILMVPPFTDYDRILSQLEKTNFRGFGLPATAMDQSKDRLANLCAVPLRAYAFSVRMAENIPDFYDRIFPVGTIKPADEKLGNYAKQCIAAIKAGKTCSLVDIIQGETNPKALMAWIHRECKIIPEGELSKLIAATLSIEDGKETFSVVDLGELGSVDVNPGTFVDIHSKATGVVESEAKSDFEKLIFSTTVKTNKKKPGAASSVLQERGRSFLKYVRKTHSHALAESMESYFRGFYSEQIQIAAVRIAQARFDEIDEEVADDSESLDSEIDDDA